MGQSRRCRYNSPLVLPEHRDESGTVRPANVRSDPPRSAAAGVHAGADRQREPRLGRRPRGRRFGADQQVCRRLPGRALLPGLRDLRPGRDARDRAGQAAFRLQTRQRPAAQRRQRQPRRDDGPDAAGRLVHFAEPRFGRTFEPRHEAQHLGCLLQARALRARSEDRADRFQFRPGQGEGAAAQGDSVRVQRVFAHHRLQKVPRDRRRV